jgi:hypothetical protein
MNMHLRRPLEIADTTLRFDERIKSPLYARHSFAEFWLINARTKATTILRRPESDRWAERLDVAAEKTLRFAALPDFAICFAAED